jgi:DNA-binding NtrC family response regulator
MLKVLLALKGKHDDIIEALSGHTVDPLPQGTSPSEHIAKNSYHLIFLEDDIEAVSSLKLIDPRIEIILFGKQEGRAMDAITGGAAAYFTWPADLEGLSQAIQGIQDVVEMRRETAELETLLTEKYTFAGIVGKNPEMLEIFSLIRRISPYYRTALITGETGTGKEVIAKALHATSPWADQPFVVCNCGGLVEGLVESELFGHVKGSFTGAVKDKTGLFEAAGEGTLFLDEIGELPRSFQPHLLRVLQDGEFRKVGSPSSSNARCRVITATNRNLEIETAQGRFREDLFFRLTPITIKVPPLRDRKDDLPLLCRMILSRFRERTGKKVFGIARPAQALLMAFDWPGNVRELENVLERAAIMTTESFIRLVDLPVLIRESSPGRPIPMTLEHVERRHIESVLKEYNGNRSKASQILGISRRALIRKIQKLGLS